jgi:hypothetical protein
MTDEEAYAKWVEATKPDPIVNPRVLMRMAWRAALAWERRNAVQGPGEAKCSPEDLRPDTRRQGVEKTKA